MRLFNMLIISFIIFQPLAYSALMCDGKEVLKLDGIYYFADGKTLAYGKCTSGRQKPTRIDLELKDGKMNGVVILFNEKDKKIFETVYQDGVINGYVREYYDDGTLKMSGYNKLGITEGKFSTFFENGMLESESTFKNGILDGPMKYFYKHGQLEMETYLSNGQENGIRRDYYENGKLKSIIPYNDGNPDGVVKIYLSDGRQVFEIYYKDGLSRNGICINGEEETILTNREIKNWKEVKCWKGDEKLPLLDLE